MSINILNVPLVTQTFTGSYHVKRSDHPTGLVVINAQNKPPGDEATLPVILTDKDEIVLPLNGWPQGGGVIFV
jgi:hypothetical protein